MRHGPPIPYRKNPPILGLPQGLGPKVMDEVTGFWYPKAYQTINLYGELVDCRGDGMDDREDRTSIRQGGE